MGVSDEDLKETLRMINSTQIAMVFILDGELFKGDNVATIKKYINEKSSKKFRIWLIDNGRLIDDSFDVDYIEPKREKLRF